MNFYGQNHSKQNGKWVDLAQFDKVIWRTKNLRYSIGCDNMLKNAQYLSCEFLE